MIDVRRFAASALAAGLLALALAAPALAKEGAVVTFVEPFPRDAEPGATVTLTWDLTVPDAGGAPAPWGGTPVGVRLASPSGAVTEAMGVETAQRGRYAAEVVVPAGPTAPPASSSVVLVVGLVALAALAVAALTVLRRRGERTTKT